MCSACLLHPMSVNQLHSTKLVVRVFGVSGTRVRLILEYDSTCVYILDMQLHQQPYKHFFFSLSSSSSLCGSNSHCRPAIIYNNWPTPKFQPLCYHRLKNLCMKIKKKKTCWFHENLKTCWFHDNWKLVDFTLKPFCHILTRKVSQST